MPPSVTLASTRRSDPSRFIDTIDDVGTVCHATRRNCGTTLTWADWEMLPAAAVSMYRPTEVPLTTPAFVTVTPGPSCAVHRMSSVRSLPHESRTRAVRVTEFPAYSMVSRGVMTIFAGLPGSTV